MEDESHPGTPPFPATAHAQAVALTGQAERLSQSLAESWRAYALAGVACAFARLDETERARHAADAAGLLAQAPDEPFLQVDHLVRVAEANAWLGRPDHTERFTRQAQDLLRSVHHRGWLAHAQAQVAAALALIGPPGPAEELARSIPDPAERVDALLLIARTTDPARPPSGVGPGTAARLVEEARLARDSITDMAGLVRAGTRVAEALAWQDRPEDARQVADDAERVAADVEATRRPGAYAQVAIALARAGDVRHAMRTAHRAEELAGSTTDPSARVGALQQVVEAYARAGDPGRATHLAGSIDEPYARASALARLAGALADAGDFGGAERVAAAITHPHSPDTALSHQVSALLDIVDALVRQAAR